MPHWGQKRSPATSDAPQVRQEPTRAPHAPQNRSFGWRELPQLAHAYGVIGLTGPVIFEARTGKRNEGPAGPSRARTSGPTLPSALDHRGQTPVGRAPAMPESVAHHGDAQ